MTCLQVLGADMAKMFPGKTAEEVMVMFDKDGTGSLDMAEIQAMKDSFKKVAVRQEATLGVPAEKKRGKGKVKEEPEGECQWSVGAMVVGAACVRRCVVCARLHDRLAGCGAPGGVCVCPCGCVKGAGVGGLNDKKALERVRQRLRALSAY